MRQYLAALKVQLAPLKNPYLVGLREGAFSRDDFVETQIQFLFAVAFFARPLSMLAARMPRPEARLEILHNVLDEHGEGDLRLSHEGTFLTLLERLGIRSEAIETRAQWPEVRAFNTTLAGLCMLDDTMTSLACLGIIEDLFSDISVSIGQGMVERGFLRRGDLVHYNLEATQHEAAHAEAYYEKLEGPYATHPRHAYQIQQGLELGGYAFLRLFEDLWRSRARRWTREVGGPHSLADGWFLDVR